MEAEGSGSARRWTRNSGLEDQSKPEEDRKGKRKVEDAVQEKMQVFDISEDESEEMEKDQENDE